MDKLPFKIGDVPIQRNFDALVKTVISIIARLGVLEATPLFASVDTSETTTSTTYVALTTAGPSLTVPTSGDYLVEVGAYMRSNVGTGSNLMSYDIGGTGAVDSDGARFDSTVAGSGGAASMARKKTLTAGTVLTAKYRVSGGTGLFAFRWLKLTRSGP